MITIARFLLLILITNCSLSFAQIGFSDDFTDGNFTHHPKWLGDTSKFIVNDSNQLQLNAIAEDGSAYLATPSRIANEGKWEFFTTLKFDPSTSNYAKVYLVSDRQNLDSSLNGYFIRIGGQSKAVDEVSLYRQHGTSSTKIIDGIDSTVAFSPRLKVKVSKDFYGNWQLFIDTSRYLNQYVLQGSAMDSSFSRSSYSGVWCKYTKSRSNLFFFDDFRADSTEVLDDVAPKLLTISVLGSNAIRLSFNEDIDSVSASNVLHYFVNNGIGNPQNINFVRSSRKEVDLYFSSHFKNATHYDLTISKIEDTSGNQIKVDTTQFFYFKEVPPAYREVVINELYPDYNPSQGLPKAEYLELFNASTKTFNLNNWSLSDLSSTASLNDIIFKPGQYLIVCSKKVEEEFQSFGTTMGIDKFPTLNNSNDHIKLRDKNGNLIDEISYDSNWYKDRDKQEGGFSLEQINPFSNCTGISNFSSSRSASGGTPGSENSIFDSIPDQKPPEIKAFALLSKNRIQITFSEAIDSITFIESTISLSPFIKIDTAVLLAPLHQSVDILMSQALDSGLKYSLTVAGMEDCEGNKIEPNTRVELLLPHRVAPNDIIINEILFNPRMGGSDFVELYNRSNKVINLKNLRSANEVHGIIDHVTEISSSDVFLYPGQYVGITENLNNIKFEYPLCREEFFVEVMDLPSYNNDEGTVYILDELGKVIDRVYYHEKFHFQLLKNKEGVSLERLSSERPSKDHSNFHSAAESVGFATPGYKNSQAFENTRFSGQVNLDPLTFSPDNDGYQDILNINYQFNHPGYVANVSIFDRNGRLVRDLINNELLGKAGSFSWDGITNENTKARIGIYVILFNAFHPNGNLDTFKEIVVLAGKL